MDRRRQAFEQNYLGLVRAAGLNPDTIDDTDRAMFTQIAGWDQAAVDALIAKLSDAGQAYGPLVRRVMNVRDPVVP
jgi:hypothetical protein